MNLKKSGEGIWESLVGGTTMEKCNYNAKIKV